MLIFAHAGHIVLDSIVYGGPVVLIACAVFLFAKFEKRLVPQRQGGEGVALSHAAAPAVVADDASGARADERGDDVPVG